MPRDADHLIAALDIGTSKIVVVIAQLLDDGTYDIVGMGQHPTAGLRKGVVVDIEATVASISKALEEAELMADCQLKDVVVGIAGSHIRSFNSTGMVAIREREVTQADIDRVIETAQAITIPADQQILHVLPQEFMIDGQEDVRQPLGMSGVRLEARVHIVTGSVSAAQNIIKCVRRCGLDVLQLVLQPLASSHVVLTPDEKELGVALVDIGGGTTDVAIFSAGAIQHTAILPIAGDQITNDIAMALRTPTREAEDIKCRHGVAKQLLASPTASFDVPGLGDRPPRLLSHQNLAAVIEPRVEELLALVANVIADSGFEQRLSSGVVMTGGSAMLPGLTELGEDIFLKQVRVASPQYRGSLAEVMNSPRYATVLGLLEEAKALWGSQQSSKPASNFSLQETVQRMKSWFSSNF